MVGENEEDDDEAQNEEAESPPRCLPGFAVGAIASTILLCGGGVGSIINPEPANASFVYYPTTNTDCVGSVRVEDGKEDVHERGNTKETLRDESNGQDDKYEK